MEIQFIGATGTVTGSKYLLTHQHRKYLVDCGLFQGLKVLRLRNWNPLPFNSKEIAHVILTHAHIDHSGFLPLLVKEGFSGRIFSTEETNRLCQILLPDAGHLQEEDALFANRHKFSKHHPALPLYTEEDARESLKFFKSIEWNRLMALEKDVSFQFLRAGHILGASMIELHIQGQKILFSGDLGRLHNLMMPPPVTPEAVDYLILESTYGDRTHPKEDPLSTMKEMILRVFGRGGTMLIPAFAVGRAQEILYLISRLKKEKSIPDIPVYLNSPMAIEATRVTEEFAHEYSITLEEIQQMKSVARFVTSVEESKRLNELSSPSIIISASGMMTGGRVLHHLKSLAPDPKNMILFVGFQSAGTRGEALIKGADHVKVHGIQIPVRAEIQTMETLSAHADADEIMAWLGKFSKAPKKVFITHGEPLASEALRKRIQEELRWNCHIPDYLEKFTL
ncbi:MAG: MBL fold metallo-hydrolase [Deltaproteobacteria bacterium]|nr:MAG: MBL fold metallo-hydrolase [Deltaproteobacteria bacterium]